MVKKCLCEFNHWKESIGYILQVDLEYPNELHALHNDYPIAPEKLAIPCDILSECCKKIADQYEIKVGDVEKLILNLCNKTIIVKWGKIYTLCENSSCTAR